MKKCFVFFRKSVFLETHNISIFEPQASNDTSTFSLFFALMNPNHQACLFIQLQGLRGYYEAAFPPKRVGFLVVLITWVADLLAMVCITKHH